MKGPVLLCDFSSPLGIPNRVGFTREEGIAGLPGTINVRKADGGGEEASSPSSLGAFA